MTHFLPSDVPRTGVFNERAHVGYSQKDHESDRDGDECPELHRSGLSGGVADGRGDGVGDAEEDVRDVGDRTGCAAAYVGKVRIRSREVVGRRRDCLRIDGLRQAGCRSARPFSRERYEDGEGSDDGDEPRDAFSADRLGNFPAQ